MQEEREIERKRLMKPAGIGRCLADNYSGDPPRQRWMSLLPWMSGLTAWMLWGFAFCGAPCVLRCIYIYIYKHILTYIHALCEIFSRPSMAYIHTYIPLPLAILHIHCWLYICIYIYVYLQHKYTHTNYTDGLGA